MPWAFAAEICRRSLLFLKQGHGNEVFAAHGGGNVAVVAVAGCAEHRRTMLRPGERNYTKLQFHLLLPSFSHNVAGHSWTFYSLIFGLRPEKAVHPTERFCTSSTLFNDVAWLPC